MTSVLGACGDDDADDPEEDAATPADTGVQVTSDGGAVAPRADAAVSDAAVADAALQDADAEVSIDAAAHDAATPSIDAGSLLDASVVDGSSDGSAPDAAVLDTASLYATDRVLEVEITLSPNDWDELRDEGRTINEIFSGCEPENFDYTMFRAAVSIDGETFADVGVRKKGFLGSISQRKPSLRLELDEYVANQNVRGAKTLTLNNNRTDASYMHTCMAYAAYRAAGVQAPRCSFARVTVNGELLGVYTHVEPIKKPFLKRVFGEDKGNLYEGSSSADFRSDRLANFEKKTNESDPTKPEIEALAALLLEPDDVLFAGLGALLDVDQYIQYWATETLIANWDAYSRNANNFFVYADPAKKLRFIPWGPDDAYDRAPALLAGAGSTPRAVYAQSRLARRLYAHEPTRERYRQALRDLLREHWDEAALLAEIDRIAALLPGIPNPVALEAQRAFMRTRRAELEAELAAPAKPWPLPEAGPIMCTPEAEIALSGSFKTTWGSLGAGAPAAENTLTITGFPLMPLVVVASAGTDTAPSTLPGSVLNLTMVQTDNSLLVVQYMIGRTTLTSGELPMHGVETFGVVLQGPNVLSLQTIGLIGDGQIVFTQAGSTPGAVVAGTFSGKLVALGAPPTAMMP